MRMDPDGTLHITNPDGRQFTTYPPDPKAILAV